MKKRMRHFCAGLLLSFLIPAFIGGQFLLTSRQDKETVSVKNHELCKEKHDCQEIDMDKAFSIVP